MATDTDLYRASGRTRTYRGHTLEEILPKIREELGPDAVILREREGLAGGVGGFFAQRFVEIEARRGDSGSIDVYDDAPGADLRPGTPDLEPEPPAVERKALLPPEPVELGRRLLPLPSESLQPGGRPAPLPPSAPSEVSARQTALVPARTGEPRPFIPPVVQRQQPTTQSRRLETTVFMDRLREASAQLADEQIAGEPAVDKPIKARRTTSAAARRKPRQAARKPTKPKSARRSPAKAQSKPKSLTPTAATDPYEASYEPRVEVPTPRRRPPVSHRRAPRPKPGMAAKERNAALLLSEAEAQASAPAPQPLPQPQAIPKPARATTRRPRSIAAQLPAPASQAPPPADAHGAVARPALAGRAGSVRSGARARRSEGLVGTLKGLVDGLRPTGPARPAPAHTLDPLVVSSVAGELGARGASQAWTARLISTAGAHGAPLSSGGLRAAAQAELARRIVPAPTLPATGAAVAFIGAGGSGKTRCTAALASAYRRGSTLEVTVLTLDNPDGARELRRLLHADHVPVFARSGERARRVIAGAREGGLVIVDTAATTPTDPAAVRALGAKLHPLGLDAVYVALPATLGAQAARRALASFGALAPAAVAITHADETDQLAVIVEIATAHRIPLAYFHAGTDHRNALRAIDPPTIVQRLLG